MGKPKKKGDKFGLGKKNPNNPGEWNLFFQPGVDYFTCGTLVKAQKNLDQAAVQFAKYHCISCGFPFDSERDRDSHFDRMHPNLPKRCKICMQPCLSTSHHSILYNTDFGFLQPEEPLPENGVGEPGTSKLGAVEPAEDEMEPEEPDEDDEAAPEEPGEDELGAEPGEDDDVGVEEPGEDNIAPEEPEEEEPPREEEVVAEDTGADKCAKEEKNAEQTYNTTEPRKKLEQLAEEESDVSVDPKKESDGTLEKVNLETTNLKISTLSEEDVAAGPESEAAPSSAHPGVVYENETTPLG